MPHPKPQPSPDKSNLSLTVVSSEHDQSILAELDKILATHRFASSPKLSNFLRYVTVETLEGRQHNISAQYLGIQYRRQCLQPPQ
ncbi:hypothetical protein [Rubritalea tangerina]|uniref:hypothetical protein n=1 Tax=Rubritalea tangerina TaxID=430798 RepID=UPI00360AF3E5